mgnify:CR=1 FL=1
MRSSRGSDVQNKPEKRAIEVGLQRVVMTSHPDVHVQVNGYLYLPIPKLNIQIKKLAAPGLNPQPFSNNRLVMKLQSVKSQPILRQVSNPPWRKWLARWAENRERQKTWVWVPLKVCIFHGISYPPKHNWLCYQGWPMAYAKRYCDRRASFYMKLMK